MPKVKFITVDDLTQEELDLASNPSLFKKYLKDNGMEIVSRPAGVAEPPGAKLIQADQAQHNPVDEMLGVKPLPLPEGQMRAGTLTVPKGVGKFAQGFLPGAAAGMAGGPLGAALMGTASGAMNASMGPDPTTKRAVGETLMNTATSALPIGKMNALISKLPAPLLQKMGIFGANAAVGGASNAATNWAGNEAARMGGEMQREAPGIGGEIASSAAASAFLAALGRGGRMVAEKTPTAIKNRLNPLMERLANTVGVPGPEGPARPSQGPPNAPQWSSEGNTAAMAPMGIPKAAGIAAKPTPPAAPAPPKPPPQPSQPPSQPGGMPPWFPQEAPRSAQGQPLNPTDPGVAAMVEDLRKKGYSDADIANRLRGSVVGQPPMQAPPTGVQQQYGATPGDSQKYALPEIMKGMTGQAPVTNPGTAAMAGEAESQLERQLRESLEMKQRGENPRAPIAQQAPVVQPDPNRVRGVTDLSQNPVYQDLRGMGFSHEQVVEAMEKDPQLRRQLSQSGYYKKPNPESGAIRIPGEDVARVRQAIDQQTQGIRELPGEARNAWADWGRNRNVTPPTENRAAADKMYLDYAKSQKLKTPNEARTQLDQMIDGDPVVLMRALEDGGPELKEAARTRITEKLLAAMRDFDKPGAEKLDILDKFHEMRKSEVGGGTTGGEVMRKVFGKDAIQNVEALYEALEKSRQLLSQQPKPGGGLHPIVRLFWDRGFPVARVLIPVGAVGVGSGLGTAAAVGAVGTVMEFGPAALGKMLAKKDSRQMNFLVDMIENSGKFTTAQIGQYMAGLASMADSVEQIGGQQQ